MGRNAPIRDFAWPRGEGPPASGRRFPWAWRTPPPRRRPPGADDESRPVRLSKSAAQWWIRVTRDPPPLRASLIHSWRRGGSWARRNGVPMNPLDSPCAVFASHGAERRLACGRVQRRPAAVDNAAAGASVEAACAAGSAFKRLPSRIALEVEEHSEVQWTLGAVHQQADQIKRGERQAGHAGPDVRRRCGYPAGGSAKRLARGLARRTAAVRPRLGGDAYGASGASTNRRRTST